MPDTQLRATFDTRANQAASSTNYGEERFLAVRTGGSNNQYSYIAFSGLPEQGSTISSATLRVWVKTTSQWTGTNDVVAQRITEPWKESQLSYLNRPDIDATTASQSVVAPNDGDSIDLDVTSIVSSVMTGGLYYGFRLSTTTGTTQRNIYSSEATNPDFRPLLLITWTSTPDAPNDLSPGGGKAVSLAKPTLTWNFRDPDGDAQSALRVLIDDASTVDGTGQLTTPEYDSGFVASTYEQFDLNTAGAGSSLPTFVAAGTVASGTGDISPALPAGWAENDILMILAENGSGDPNLAAPSGWAHVTGSPVNTAGTRCHVFWRRATAAETAPTIVDTGNHAVGRMFAIRGCPTVGNPWETTVQSSEGTSDTTGSITGMTTSSANCLIVLCATNGFDPASDGTASYSAFTNAALGSLTEQIDNQAAAGTGGGIGMATGTKATAGAVGTTTYTLANADVKAHLAIAMLPSAGSGGSYGGITDGNTRYWQVQTKDEQGNTSPWSDVQQIVRTSKGTLAISSPTTGGTVEETSPPIITTLTGRTQESISYLLDAYDSTTNEWVTVWQQDKRAAPATSGSAYNFGIPAGYINALSTNYRLTVRSWDTIDRDATPGDPLYVQAQSTFTFVRSATPSAVTTLTVANEASNGPGVLLTFNRGAGVAAPDYFALVVDGERVLDRIDPAPYLVGGDPIVFAFVWYGSNPQQQHTYEVEAVVMTSGALKHSQSNATQNFTPAPQGIWLIVDDDPPYVPGSPPKRVRLEGTSTPGLAIAQSGATYHPVGRRDPVTIVDAIGGYSGDIAGRIRAADTIQPNGIENFLWMKLPRNVGRRFRLIQGGLSVPVELGEVSNFAPVGDAGAVRTMEVSFHVDQVAEFGE
jgi:hypothetical protein